MIGSTQAAVDKKRKRIMIIAPTIMSTRKGAYGAEDIGMKGIRNFFYWNPTCGSGLVPRFVKPRHTGFYYEPCPTNRAKCNGDDDDDDDGYY